MGLNGIIKNVFKLGILQTYELGKENERAQEEQNCIQKETIDEQADLDRIRELRKAFLVAGHKEEIKNLSSEISDAEHYLRAKYIKEIFPTVYDRVSQQPIQNKVVIMERGRILSQNFKSLTTYLKANTDFEIDIHILKAGEVELEDYLLNAKEYIRSAARAKAIFICTANELTGYFSIRPETTYIQLWHACGAFKKFGLSTTDKKFGKSAKSHEEYPINTNYDYVTIASPESSWIYEEAMGIDKDLGVIVPTGISRTDVFFDEEYVSRCYKKLYKKIPSSHEKKVILYAPTFRGEVAESSSPAALDIEKFAEELGDEYVLIIKHHQSAQNIPPIPEKYKDTFAYDMTRGKGININELLTVADICISDYSSLVFEYSLFERPMIFFAFDLDDYIDYRGLYYDYVDFSPGPVFDNNDEMIDYIKHVSERFDEKQVIEFKNKFMNCCDGNSTERIVNLFR